MHSDARGVKRPVKERLGTSFSRPPALPGCEHQEVLKRSIPHYYLLLGAFLSRKRQDNFKWSNDFYGVENHEVRDSVPKNLTTSDMQKDVQRVSKSNISSTTKIQKKTVGNAQTPTDICSGVSKGRSTAEVNSAKTPAVQSGSASMTKEKKHIVVEQLTIAAFLQKLGLSKYLIAFQAEEVDMFALKHMNNDDLRSIGLPMGPRKKILLALAAAKAKK
ncbi:ankyrin repeat and SAM domain-containing protein 6-like isoform X2 [Phoenix dactylifera]|uniref:Ankyrin repeat and SAM domain-containing protein 6-like isoform X2 n=1 Tax=Phoenix dactylifera TaxID=42345 RepID=A0A8B9AIC0_PHODC|nr:ankyrin repeat and SAM domain-containing protein 6-like isoform X2 [Phoenix dactylifera]